MKFIKDTPKGTSKPEYDVVAKMEEEWPEMTKEFKKIQKISKLMLEILLLYRVFV